MKGFKPYFLFILTGVIYVLYSAVVYYVLDNPNFLRSKTKPGLVFHVHEIYIWVGIIWIAIGLFYLCLFKSTRISLSSGGVYKHFFLTLPVVLGLAIVPIMDTYYPNATDIETIKNIIIYGGIFSTFAFFAGKVFFLKNVIQAGLSFLTNR